MNQNENDQAKGKDLRVVVSVYLAAGGFGTMLHEGIERAKKNMAPEDARFHLSTSFDLDAASSDHVNGDFHQIGTIEDPDSGGAQDPGLLGGLKRTRQVAVQLMDRSRGGGANRLVAHKGFVDDFHSERQVVSQIERILREAVALNPTEIIVYACANTAGSAGAAFLRVACALLKEARIQGDVTIPIIIQAAMLPPGMVPPGADTKTLQAHSAATMIEVVAQTAGLLPETPDFDFGGITPYAAAILLPEVRRPASDHTHTSKQEARRALEASIRSQTGTLMMLNRTTAGRLIESRAINHAPSREGEPRILASRGLIVPRSPLVAMGTSTVVNNVLNNIILFDADGYPIVRTPKSSAIQTLTTNADPIAQELFLALRILALEGRPQPIADPDWRHAARIFGFDVNQAAIFPIIEIPVSGRLRRGSVPERVLSFREEVGDVSKIVLDTLRRGLLQARTPLKEKFVQRLEAVSLDVFNRAGIFMSETNRPALLIDTDDFLVELLNTLKSRWAKAFRAATVVPDGFGGYTDRRKELADQYEKTLLRISQGFIYRVVPFLATAGLKHARELAAEKLDLDCLDAAVHSLSETTNLLVDEVMTIRRSVTAMAATLEAIRTKCGEASAEAKQVLFDDQEYGSNDFVGVEAVHAAMAPVIESESITLEKNITFGREGNTFIGFVSGTSFEKQSGSQAPEARNFSLVSASPRVALTLAAETISITSQVAKEFGSPEKLLNRLRLARPENEVARSTIMSGRQPLSLGILVVPAKTAADATVFFRDMPLALQTGEEIVFREGFDEVQYVAAILGVKTTAIRSFRRWVPAYIKSGNPVHIDAPFELARRLSQALYLAEGELWVPRPEVSLLLADAPFIRQYALALGAGLLKAKEVSTAKGPMTVFSLNGGKPGISAPDAGLMGLELIEAFRKPVLRASLAEASSGFDRREAAKRLKVLSAGITKLPPVSEAAIGTDPDLRRLVRLMLLGEKARLERLLSTVEIEVEG